ncbi:MAG: hypothetical protein GXO47_01750 [Chlorobi bacterium]|nr:hypothetical protein [Chlorobiota bacterium]
MSKKLLPYLFFILVCTTESFAQYYSSGSDPASIRWFQIKTDHFRIVFPEKYKKEAQRAVAIFEKVYQYGGYTLGHKPKRIDVLIHSESAYSNGFVSWAPKRIELYPSPNQDIFAQDYLQQLAIHEFRHVVQIDKLNTGFTRALGIIAGQQAVGAVLGIYVPMWFMEGDAVMTETMLSHSGRGRLPSFSQELKAQLLEKGVYKYDKAYLGSYRDYIPNYYVMGYHLVSGARNRFGNDVWEKAIENTGKRSWSITPFNHGIKEVTGLNKTELYMSVFNEWKEMWEKENEGKELTKFRYLTARDPKYKNYRYSRFLNDSIIVSRISGPGEVQRFVTINIKSGKEQNLFTPGYTERAPFSLASDKLVWSEQEQNYRWSNAEQYNIWIYNLKTGKAKRLTRGKRYYAPSLSPDGNTIATVHISKSGNYNILLLDAENGKTTDTINTPDNRFAMTPVWTPDGSKIVTVVLTPDGKQLFYLTLNDRKWHPLTTPSFANIREPFATDSYVYFSYSPDETENIFRININTKNIEQITSSQFGNTSAALNGNTLTVSDYCSDGYRPAVINLDSISVKKTQFTAYAPEYPFLKKTFKEEKGLPGFNNLKTDTFEVKKYSRWNLFNFHSWAPVYINFNDLDLNYGASLLSQNLLGNAFTTFGYNADKQYTREKFYFNFIYNGWFPKLNFEAKYGNDDAYYDQATETDTFIVESLKKQQFLRLNLDISIPFNISRGAWHRHVEPLASIGYLKAFDYDALKSYITNIDGKWYYTGETENITAKGYDINTFEYGLFAYNLRKRSIRDVATRLGQVFQFTYKHSPYGDYDFGSITGVHTTVYFPGFYQHHSIRINNDWHKKIRGEKAGINSSGYIIRYGFSDFINIARGYTDKYNDELYTFRSDYIMPVWYPDITTGSLAYFKRITTNIFYDYSKASYKLQDNNTGEWFYGTNTYQSAGTEIRAEVHLLRFIFPFSIGYRYSYLINDNRSRHEFLFSINFSGYTVN